MSIEEKNTASVNYNPGWLGLLGIIFVLCKIFAVAPIAAWSWWLVLLPFYAGLAIVLIIVGGSAAVFGIILGVATLLEKYQARKRRIANEKARVWEQLNNKE